MKQHGIVDRDLCSLVGAVEEPLGALDGRGLLSVELARHDVGVLDEVGVQPGLGRWVDLVVKVVEQQPPPGTVADEVVELRVVLLIGLMQVRAIVQQGLDSAEHGVCSHAECPGLARPGAQNT